MLKWTIRFRFGGMESALSYLEQMAAKGWLLEYWQGNTLLFRRTEPKQLRFAMDIVPIGRWKLDGGRDNEKVREEYVAMYEEQGWHFVEHHERKFLFYTADETVPMPQTDPVAYQDSVYRHHRNTTGWFVFLSILGAAFLHHMWHVLYLYVRTPIGTGLLQLILVLLLYSCFGVFHNGIPMVREKRILKKGQIPQTCGNEWWGRLMAVCLVIALGGVCRMSVKYMGKQAMEFLAFGICLGLQWGIVNIGPLILYRLNMPSLDQAKKYAYKIARILHICALLMLAFSTDTDDQSVRMKCPQGVVPLVTLEEVYGEEVTYLQQTYECGAAELYYYSGRGPQYYISYRMVISSWDAVRRSFERNPDGYYSYWYGARDHVDYWKPYMVDLEAAQLGVNIAWQVNYVDAIPYRYYLETDEAALFLGAEQEIPMEWLQEISARLRQIQ